MWIIHLYIFFKLLIIFYNLFMHFELVFNRICCIGLWYFCSVSCNSSLYCCRNSYFYFLKIHVWPIPLFIKSSLCVEWSVLSSHMGVTYMGWSAFISCAVLLLQWVKQDGWLREGVLCVLKIWIHLVWGNVSITF